jgi:hypothetical protein
LVIILNLRRFKALKTARKMTVLLKKPVTNGNRLWWSGKACCACGVAKCGGVSSDVSEGCLCGGRATDACLAGARTERDGGASATAPGELEVGVTSIRERRSRTHTCPARTDGRTGARMAEKGVRTPCRQLSSQIVSKDEIAEEIAKRFSKSAQDTTRSALRRHSVPLFGHPLAFSLFIVHSLDLLGLHLWRGDKCFPYH